MKFIYNDYAFLYEKGRLECAVLNENKDIIKTMDFAIEGCFDFIFHAMNFSEETNLLTFEIDRENPIYIPLVKLINNDKLLIDDDLTRESNKKYLLIEKYEDKVYVKFNKSKDDESFIFDISVINIVFDLRSKVDQQNLDTKSRLLNFFNDLEVVFKSQKNKTYKKVIKWQK